MKPRIILVLFAVVIMIMVLLWLNSSAPSISESPKPAITTKPAGSVAVLPQIVAPTVAPVTPSAKEVGEQLATAGDPRMKLDTTMQYYIQMLQAGDYRAYYRSYYYRDGLGYILPASSDAEREAQFKKMLQQRRAQNPEMAIPDITLEQAEEAGMERMRLFVQGPTGKAALKVLEAIQLLPIPEGAESQPIVGFDVPDPDTGANWHVTFHKVGKFWIPYFPPRQNAANISTAATN